MLVAWLCPTLCNPMVCSLPGSSVHGIFQAGILKWVAIPFSRRECWSSGDWSCPSQWQWDSCWNSVVGKYGEGGAGPLLLGSNALEWESAGETGLGSAQKEKPSQCSKGHSHAQGGLWVELCPQKNLCCSAKPQYLKILAYLQVRSLQSNEVKMRSWGGPHPYDWVS